MGDADDRAFFGHSKHRVADVSFRPIRDDDREFLKALYASTRIDELAPVPWPESAKLDFLAQQFELQHAYYHDVYRDADFLIICLRDIHIGRIYISRTSAEIRVVDIALVPECRGRGIGSSLMVELIDEARATHRDIGLHVEPHNPAQRLYARLGFKLFEHRGVYDFMTWSAHN